MHGEAEFGAMIHCPSWPEGKVLLEEVHQDAQLLIIIQALQQNQPTKPGFSYTNGVLLYEGRLVASAKSPWIPILLKEFHATPQGGHSGFYWTYRRVAANLYWFRMKSRVQQYVQEWYVCQRQKYLAASPGGLQQPLNILEQVWEEISMDFITGLDYPNLRVSRPFS